MTEQYTNFANVRVEDIPAGSCYCAQAGWVASYRSPEKIKSLNGQMEYHYILEWLMRMPSGECLIREEYFGDKIISTSYRYECGGITQVYYSTRAAYFMEDGGVRKEELKDNKAQPTQQPAAEKTDEFSYLTVEDKLRLAKGILKEFMSILDGAFIMNDKSTEADNAGEPIRYFGAAPDQEENPDTKLPMYQGAYLHAEALTGERVTVDGEEYLIMNYSPINAATRCFRVGKKTQIVHLMDYVRVYNVDVGASVDGWTPSNGKVVVHGPEGERTTLAAGTKFKVLDRAVMNRVEFNPGTLAVRYADYDYPTL